MKRPLWRAHSALMQLKNDAPSSFIFSLSFYRFVTVLPEKGINHFSIPSLDARTSICAASPYPLVRQANEAVFGKYGVIKGSRQNLDLVASHARSGCCVLMTFWTASVDAAGKSDLAIRLFSDSVHLFHALKKYSAAPFSMLENQSRDRKVAKKLDTVLTPRSSFWQLSFTKMVNDS